MSRRRLAEVEAVFQAVVELPPEERERVLAERCGDDPEFRAYVDRLLANHDAGIAGFLETSPGPATVPPACGDPDQAVPFRVGHYEIADKLGEGGMGIVYEAEDLKLRRTVALKFLSSDALGSEGATRRFLREARTAASLNHPNVCTVFEVGEVEPPDQGAGGDQLPPPGTPYIAMERIEGRTLAEAIDSPATEPAAPMPLSQVLDLALQVAEGLAAAHTRGIVHRDLKPGNVMVTAEGRIKILDFGLAKPIPNVSPDSGKANTAEPTSAGQTRDEPSDVELSDVERIDVARVEPERSLAEQTREGVIVGTVAYMSPEQAAGKPVDARSDVFSLGIMLYEMTTGQRPFSGATAAATMVRIIEQEQQPLDAIRGDLPAELERIVRRCLQKAPEDRYDDARDLASALRELRDQLEDAGKVARASRRGRIARAAVLAAAMAAVALTSAWWWSSQRQSVGGGEIRADRLTAVGDMGNWLTGAALSPDGSMLAYVHHLDLYLALLDTGELRTLVRHEEGRHGAYWVDWHPDSKRVVSEEWVAEEQHAKEWYINATIETWLIDVATGHREFLHRETERTGPRVSPDGEHVALARNGSRQLAVLHVPTDSLMLLWQAEGDEILHSPVWSPGGKRLAYMIERGEKGLSDLETCNLEGNRSTIIERAALDTGEGLGTLCWLADERLVYARQIDIARTVGEFWAIKVDHETGVSLGVPRKMFSLGAANLRGPTVTSNGQTLAFTREQTHRRIRLIQLGEMAIETDIPRVCLADWPAGFPVWSRDSRRVFFCASTRHEDEVVIYVRDLDADREEPFLNVPDRGFPQCLTPDGSRLIYWQGQDLMSSPVAGGQAKRLDGMDWQRSAPYPGPKVRCAVAPGSTCVVGDVVGTDLVLHELEADGRIGAEILRLGLAPGNLELSVAAFDLSPDGTQVVVTECSGRIRLVNLRTGDVRVVPRDWPGFPYFVTWSEDGEWLYLTGFQGESNFWMRRMSLDGRSEILWESKHVQGFALAPSPDGRHVVFETTEVESDIWMIEGF